MEEIWKDVVGYEGLYQVSNLGNIKALNYYRRGYYHILKQQNDNGYRRVNLCIKKTKKRKCIHRLVAEAFIPNPEKKPCINHKDGVRCNNNVSNLERCTYSENTIHSFYVLHRRNSMQGRTGSLSPHRKKIVQSNMDGSIVKIWGSAIEIGIATGYSLGIIGRCYRGKKDSVFGFKWNYYTN